MDLIGVIASRLIENMPDSETQSDERKDALLERALMYAAQAEQQIASQNQRIEYLQSLSCTDELPKTKVSLGIEPYGPNDTPEELVRRADMAMYYVKRSKKGPMVRDAAE